MKEDPRIIKQTVAQGIADHRDGIGAEPVAHQDNLEQMGYPPSLLKTLEASPRSEVSREVIAALQNMATGARVASMEIEIPAEGEFRDRVMSQIEGREDLVIRYKDGSMAISHSGMASGRKGWGGFVPPNTPLVPARKISEDDSARGGYGLDAGYLIRHENYLPVYSSAAGTEQLYVRAEDCKEQAAPAGLEIEEALGVTGSGRLIVLRGNTLTIDLSSYPSQVFAEELLNSLISPIDYVGDSKYDRRKPLILPESFRANLVGMPDDREVKR